MYASGKGKEPLCTFYLGMLKKFYAQFCKAERQHQRQHCESLKVYSSYSQLQILRGWNDLEKGKSQYVFHLRADGLQRVVLTAVRTWKLCF